MGKIGTYTWTGASGRKYEMDAYTLAPSSEKALKATTFLPSQGTMRGI